MLDTWFSSALWPFSTLGWPDETPELKRFYPTDTLVTGFDIIFFWVARMMMMGLHFMKKIPFRDVYIHALVRDEKGAKMSKSKGNVIDPIDLIDRFGADALRFTLAAMAAQGRDIKLSEARIEGYRNFATKLWNASRFAEMNGCVRVEGFDPSAAREPLNRWILGEAAKAAAETARRSKPIASTTPPTRLIGSSGASSATGISNSRSRCCRAGATRRPRPRPGRRSPMCSIRSTRSCIRSCRSSPKSFGRSRARPGLGARGRWRSGRGPAGFEVDEAVEAEIGWVVDLIAEIRSVRSEMGVPPSTQTPLIFVAPSERAARSARAWSESIRRLARVGSIETAEAAPPGALLLVVRGETVALPLAGVVDLTAEKARLDKEIAKERLEIAKVEAKLGNDDFVARAPEDIIAEHQDRLETFQARLVKLTGARERLERV